MFSIRLMHDQDIPAILDIQTEAYASDLLESEAIIRARRASAPRHAWVAEDDQGVCAYLFAYHSRVGKVTPLDGEFRTPAQPDCLYLHDLAVAPRALGRASPKERERTTGPAGKPCSSSQRRVVPSSA